MDSKRPHQHRALSPYTVLTAVLAVAMSVVLTACTWTRDDSDGCQYGFWLRLSYTYNIMDVEAVQRYIGDTRVYVYDADGTCVSRIDVTAAQLSKDGWRVRIEGLAEGDYRFVVWSGLGSNHYTVASDSGSQSDFRLALAGASPYATALSDLYYGRLDSVHYTDTYAEHTVSMVKDTNQLTCVAVSVGDEPITTADCTMQLLATNGVMDATNGVATADCSVYEPYATEAVTIDDPDYGLLGGVMFSLRTLRLLEGDDSRLQLLKTGSGSPQTVLDISVPQYVGLVGEWYTNLGRKVGLQEYLDRQDYYTLVFIFSEGLGQLLQLKVNNWNVRANNHLKI